MIGKNLNLSSDGETKRERNNKIMKNQDKFGWRSRKGGEMRINKNRSEKMGKIEVV